MISLIRQVISINSSLLSSGTITEANRYVSDSSCVRTAANSSTTITLGNWALLRLELDIEATVNSEVVRPKVAVLGYSGRRPQTKDYVYNERWFDGDANIIITPTAPITSFAFVFTVDGVDNLPVSAITKCDIILYAEAWELEEGGKLNNIDIPEALTYSEVKAERPGQINVYDINEPQDGFNHNGLAILLPTECISDKEELGRWDLTIVHPIDDYQKWTYIIIQNVLKVNGQLFRIDETEIYQDAEQAYITAHAKHITYDLFDRFVDEVTVENVSGGTYIGEVIQRSQEILPTHQPEPNEYTFDVTSNITGPVTTKVQDQTVIGAIFGDDNSLATRYGGQLYRDNFHMSVNTTQEGAPTAPAFKLRFGTDLTKLSYKIDCSEWITELICKDNFGDVWAISYTGSTWIIHHQKTRVMHFTYDPNTPDPYDCLTKDGFAYWQTVSTPTVSIEVSIANLKNDPKYKDFVDLQNLDVGYEGNVYIEQYGIDVNLKIVSIRRDELTGEALQVVLGTSRGSFIRSPVMSQTIVANGTVLGKQEAEMQAMKDQMDDMTLKQMRFWRGMSSYKWTDAQNYTWREILNGHKDNTL